MIPILFASTETAFTTQGLGRLLDARKCEVTEERNGIYELVMEYPVSGALFSKIQPGCYIFATHDDSGTPQAFQIYKTSAPIEGWMEINAWHISYALNSIVVAPFTATTCATAIAGVKTNSMNTNPFTFQTDKVVTANFSLDVPASARAILGGMEGSILDVYGSAEYEFDMFTVKLLAHRGANNGVTIRYGKNLTKLDYELDASNVYNACVPYWSGEETNVVLDHVVVRTGQTAKNTIALDLSSDFDEPPTAVQLEAKAQSYLDASSNYQVKDNIQIDFVALWQTEEYKIYSGLERVKLCDTVTIYYEKFGINATAKVIKVVYNTLLDRYSSIELGEPKTSLSQQIQQDVSPSILSEVPKTVKRMLSGDVEIGGDFTADGDVQIGGDLTVSGTITGQRTVLWSGTKVESGNVNLSESFTNYRDILFVAQSNAEFVSAVMPSAQITGTTAVQLFEAAGSWSGSNFEFCATLNVARVSDTQFTVNSVSNNQYFKLGLVAVIGYK